MSIINNYICTKLQMPDKMKDMIYKYYAVYAVGTLK